ncbi:hypothetical protein [Streptomyces sioyaensis]|uniref:hypothetical protein n=1 Tax=Streptomyces sioyaensis TaxID=67364 RepID=UPI0037AD0034
MKVEDVHIDSLGLSPLEWASAEQAVADGILGRHHGRILDHDAARAADVAVELGFRLRVAEDHG